LGFGKGGETRREKRKEIPFYSAVGLVMQKMVWDCVQIFAISLASAVTAEGALAPPQFFFSLLGKKQRERPPIQAMLTFVRWWGSSAVVAAHLPNGELLQSAGQGREAHQEAYAHQSNFFYFYLI
jgi:hypothetical protein